VQASFRGRDRYEAHTAKDGVAPAASIDPIAVAAPVEVHYFTMDDDFRFSD